jgi:hypothetical protein
LNGANLPEVIDQPDIGRFSRKSFAIEHAINWAQAWIDGQP